MKQKKALQIISIIITFVLILSAVGYVGWNKLDGIYSRLDNLKVSISRENESAAMHEDVINVSELAPLEDEQNAWYTQYHFISHSGGV